MKHLAAGIAAAVAMAGLAALVSSTPVSAAPSRVSGNALVRVAHFSPDTAGVDVWVDGQRVLRNVGYDTVSDYVPLPAGDHQFALRPFGAAVTTKAILSSSSVLAPNLAYTIAGVGLNRQLRGQIFDDNLGAPPANAAKVRVIDAVVGTPLIKVTLDGGSSFGAVRFASASAYMPISAKTYSVRVSAAGPVVLSVPNVIVGAGIIYTFAVIGGGGKPVQLVPVVDARAPTVTPVGPAATGGGGTARVRLRSASSRGGAIIGKAGTMVNPWAGPTARGAARP